MSGFDDSEMDAAHLRAEAQEAARLEVLAAERAATLEDETRARNGSFCERMVAALEDCEKDARSRAWSILRMAEDRNALLRAHAAGALDDERFSAKAARFLRSQAPLAYLHFLLVLSGERLTATAMGFEKTADTLRLAIDRWKAG